MDCKVVASLNLAYSGYLPQEPILDAHGNCPDLDPPASNLFVHVLPDSEILRVRLTELRGDWKFYKALWMANVEGSKQLYICVCIYRNLLLV